MASKPKLPAIPAIPNDVTPGMRGLLSAMREVLQVQAGQGRGDELDKAVTFRDLGLTSMGGSSTAMMGRVINGLMERGEIGTNNAVERPTTPTGVNVSAFVGGIAVSWDLPRYSGHAYTEVFAQPTPVNAQEQPVNGPALNTETMLLGTSASPLLGVQARTTLGYYIWVRHVNSLGQVGSVHTPLGAFLYLPPSPSFLLEQLTNEITRDQLSVALQQPIDLVPTLQTAITTEQTTRANADTALSSSISTVSAVANAKIKTYRQSAAPSSGMTAGDLWFDTDDNNKTYRYSGSAWTATDDTRIAANAASVQTNATAIANLDGTYTAQWSTKTTVGALTGGFGIFNDGTTTRFTVHANRFAIMDTSLGNTPFVPFVVDNGKTVISDAFIRTAYIEQLAAGQITAARINALNLNAIQITGGTLSLGGGNNMSFQEGGSAGFGKGGPYGGWGYGWNTIIYNDGSLYTNRLYASGGTFSNVTISENCNVLGTVYANKLVGDVTAVKSFTFASSANGGSRDMLNFNIASSTTTRYLVLPTIRCSTKYNMRGRLDIILNGGVVHSVTMRHTGAVNPDDSVAYSQEYDYKFPTFTLSANVQYNVRIYLNRGDSWVGWPEQNFYVMVVPQSTGTFI